jgi:hypothetical protein
MTAKNVNWQIDAADEDDVNKVLRIVSEGWQVVFEIADDGETKVVTLGIKDAKELLQRAADMTERYPKRSATAQHTPTHRSTPSNTGPGIRKGRKVKDTYQRDL